MERVPEAGHDAAPRLIRQTDEEPDYSRFSVVFELPSTCTISSASCTEQPMTSIAAFIPLNRPFSIALRMALRCNGVNESTMFWRSQRRHKDVRLLDLRVIHGQLHCWQ